MNLLLQVGQTMMSPFSFDLVFKTSVKQVFASLVPSFLFRGRGLVNKEISSCSNMYDITGFLDFESLVVFVSIQLLQLTHVHINLA